jgi:geranylgeranyl reductase family protein
MTGFDCDVAIAGAGPAGSYAAYLLARAGVRVALLDRARFPREKVCGGGLSAKTLALLEPAPDPVVHRTFTGAWIAWRGRRAFVKDLGRAVGCTVLRSEFDHWLVLQAQAAGAKFHAETAVRGVAQGADGARIDTARGAFRARIVLAADGVASTLRAQLFGRRAVRYAPAVEALVHCSAQRLERLGDRVLFDLGGMPRGYGWIFPKRDHVNAGVYSIFAGAGIRGHLQTFLQRHGLLADTPTVRVCGHAIPVRNAIRSYQSGSVWLLGDAAGFAEAVYGEGIYFALKSAKLAASVLLETGGAPPPGEYERRVRTELEPELRWSQRVGRALFSIGPLAFDPLARSRLACAWFAALVTGELSYRDCFWRAVAGAPAWLLSPRHPLQPRGDWHPGV